MCATMKFRIYLLCNFDVIRDHQVLAFLNTCKLTHSRLSRWILALQEYNYSWSILRILRTKYLADTLSRIHYENNKVDKDI